MDRAGQGHFDELFGHSDLQLLHARIDKIFWDDIGGRLLTSGSEIWLSQSVRDYSHDQAIDRLAAGLEVEAWHPGDDIIEQVQLRDYPFCLSVQYHPDRDAIYRPLFDAFLEHIK
jgi:putative glutamine amidotransferase